MAKDIIGADARFVSIFSNNLRFTANLKDISAAEIAKKTDISYYKMRQYFNGGARPSDSEVKQIAKYLGCSVEELTDPLSAPTNFGGNYPEDC